MLHSFPAGKRVENLDGGDSVSFWSYVHGTIVVRPIGRTQEEEEYVLKTVLKHLPVVSGSEKDMDVYIIQKNGHDSLQSCDEFGEITNNLTDRYGNKSRKNGWLRTQSEYILVVDGALRDREFEDTYREFVKWLCRLAKRVRIKNVCVEVKGYEKSALIKDNFVGRKKYSWHKNFEEMFEEVSWANDYEEFSEPNWCEYLLWDSAKNSRYPMLLRYKYFADKENDEEVERRMTYRR